MNGETPRRHNKMTALLAVVIAVILLAASFLVGYTVGGGKAVVPGLGGVARSDCSDSQVLQRLLNAGYLPPEFDPSHEVIFASGVITEVGSDYVEVKAALSPIDDAVTLRANISADTNIVRQIPKDPETLNQEFEAFNRTISTFSPESGGMPPEPPEPFTEKKMKLSDLKVNMTVSITSATNIRENTTFDAVQLYINETAAAALAPPMIPPATPDNIAPPPMPPVDEVPDLEPEPEEPIE